MVNNVGTETIHSERLVYKKITLDDVDSFYELLIDKDVQKYLPGIPIYTGKDMAISYISDRLSKKYQDNNFYDWGIFLDEKLIGRITVYKQDEDRRMADLVWYLNPNYRGKGYMTEAAITITNFLKDIGFERIEAFANVENVASQKVMKKAGFQFEGILRKYDTNRDDSLYDAAMYSITD